jgi:hypothetical protein
MLPATMAKTHISKPRKNISLLLSLLREGQAKV